MINPAHLLYIDFHYEAQSKAFSVHLKGKNKIKIIMRLKGRIILRSGFWRYVTFMPVWKKEKKKKESLKGGLGFKYVT